MARPKKENTPEPQEPQIKRVAPVITENTVRAVPIVRQSTHVQEDFVYLVYIPNGNRLKVSRDHAVKMARNSKNYRIDE